MPRNKKKPGNYSNTNNNSKIVFTPQASASPERVGRQYSATPERVGRQYSASPARIGRQYSASPARVGRSSHSKPKKISTKRRIVKPPTPTKSCFGRACKFFGISSGGSRTKIRRKRNNNKKTKINVRKYRKY
jgi:hypothetical protein